MYIYMPNCKKTSVGVYFFPVLYSWLLFFKHSVSECLFRHKKSVEISTLLDICFFLAYVTRKKFSIYCIFLHAKVPKNGFWYVNIHLRGQTRHAGLRKLKRSTPRRPTGSIESAGRGGRRCSKGLRRALFRKSARSSCCPASTDCLHSVRCAAGTDSHRPEAD